MTTLKSLSVIISRVARREPPSPLHPKNQLTAKSLDYRVEVFVWAYGAKAKKREEYEAVKWQIHDLQALTAHHTPIPSTTPSPV